MIPIEDKKTKTKGTINSLTENLYPFSKINKRVIKIVISQNVRFPATLNPKTDKWKFKNYVLTVGSVEPRKNIQRLISAFLEAKKELDPSLKLVIVGKRGNDNIFNNSNQEQLKNV
ncbi:glycosyltransferase, partial [Klebsiella pneumoniae]|uniref:glycosyltransferase n=1 Tax=Klebsiella pneumoniae TaxID=573 RepID=UPI003D26ED64